MQRAINAEARIGPEIALIEDNPALREELLRLLADNGYAAWGAGSAEHFYRELHGRQADVLVVDIGLPGENGLDLIRYMRSHCDMGIIALTARENRDERLEGFRSGVDHYLVKPADPTELLAIISSLWRRLAGNQTSEPARAQWRVNLKTGELLFPGGECLTLTSSECLLLDALLQYPDETISKDDLHAVLFPKDHTSGQADPHRIDVIMSRIRGKVKNRDLKLPVRSVFGRGLVFITED